MKLTIEQFELLKAITPIVKPEQEEEKKEIKFKLLDGMQSAFSDKWYNLKKPTKQALQYACMLSTEQGFFYCSPTHLKNKYGVGISTIYNNLTELVEKGVLIRINRTATSHNGRGSAVYILTEHPNFSLICELLNIKWKADCKANEKAENAENPTLPKAESVNSAPTYSLPTSLQKTLKDKDVKPYNANSTENNTQSDSLDILKDKIEEYERRLPNEQNMGTKKPKWHKYVPKAINEKFGYFGSILTDLWRKIKLAERKINDSMLQDNEKLSVAETVLENLRKHPRFKSMSLDEMCAYVYKGQLNGLFALVGNQYLERMEGNAYEDTYGNYIPTITPFGNLELYVMTQLMYGQLKEGSYPAIMSMLDKSEEVVVEENIEYDFFDIGFNNSMDAFCDLISESAI